MWLSCLAVVLQIKRELVGFLVRAQAWIAGSLPRLGQPICFSHTMFLSLSFFLPFPSLIKKIVKNIGALAGEAQWIEHQPANQRVTSLIPSQGICLGCGRAPSRGVLERQPHTNVSLPLFLPPFPL